MFPSKRLVVLLQDFVYTNSWVSGLVAIKLLVIFYDFADFTVFPVGLISLKSL